MKPGEVPPSLDVHPPHEPVHGWRDFLLHILTITIGLLIALGLEGVVEWQHHRHLVHEAEASLHHEIEKNAQQVPGVMDDLHKHQAELKKDVAVLDYIIKNGKAPKDSSTTVSARIVSFDSVSWRTAQVSGAIAYMPYAKAQEYANIYFTQEELDRVQEQAARDAILVLGPLADADDNTPDPFHGQAAAIKEKIEVLEGQLYMAGSFYEGLDRQYKSFLASDHE